MLFPFATMVVVVSIQATAPLAIGGLAASVTIEGLGPIYL